MLSFVRGIIGSRDLGGKETPKTVVASAEGAVEDLVVGKKVTIGQDTSFNMNGECAVCLNSLMEAAPAPPSAAVSNGVVGTVGEVALGAPPRKRAKKLASPKLEESRSLDDTFATPCGHVFHAQCLKQWYLEDGKGAGNSQKASCPNCRKPVTKASLLQVFIGGGERNLRVPTPRSSTGPSTSAAAPSQPSSSGASMTSMPAPVGSRKRRVPDMVILDGAAPVAYQGNDFNELRDLHNLLIQDYAAMQQRVEALEEERDILKAQFLSVQPDEVVVVNGNAHGNGTTDNRTGAGGPVHRTAGVAPPPKRQTAIRGRRASVRNRC